MSDELAPISGARQDPFGGWAATLVDSLDTLWIMDLKDEFQEAVTAAVSIDFSRSSLQIVNVFETTIRYMGGFLAAYDLSKDERLLTKAVHLGDMLLAAFDTPNRMPITRWHFEKARAGQAQVADDFVLSAEIGSLVMEFTRLSQITGDDRWYDATRRVMHAFATQQNDSLIPGMWPLVVDAKNANFSHGDTFTLGSMADSLYEYLPKMHLLLGGVDDMYAEMYALAAEAAIKHTLWRPMTPDNATILVAGSADFSSGKETLETRGQHLMCYTGGFFALGGRLFGKQEHVQVGLELTDGCLWTYRNMPLRIMPEVFTMHACPGRKSCEWDEKVWKEQVKLRAAETDGASTPADEIIRSSRLPQGFTSIDDGRYILRPEAIESVFLLWRMTGRADLPNAAWDMFTSIQKATETPLANAAIADVRTVEGRVQLADSMESFWLAETLKYFYLVFSEPELISLDEWVFNTEAHPLRRAA